MYRGKNPDRDNRSQMNHDLIIEYIAKDLVSQGYTVYADHIDWPAGSPDAINGFTPDITAYKDDSFLIFEVETCPTYSDAHTRSQLIAFSKAAPTYIIVPTTCFRVNQEVSSVSQVQTQLRTWNLNSVRVGTCDLSTGQLSYELIFA